MKKILYTIFTALTLVLVSCDNDPEVYDGDKNGSLVYFTNGTSGKASVADTGVDFTYLIEVGATTKSNVDRTFTVEFLPDDNLNDDIEYATPAHYSIDQSSLVIPANSYLGSISLITNYNILPDVGSVFLKIKLTEITGGKILNDSNVYTVEMFRSCPKSLASSYIAFPTRTGGTSLPSYTPVLTPISGMENTWHVNSAWGPNAVASLTGSPAYNGQYLYSGRLTINCDNTVDFVGLEDALPGGTGTFDPITGEITLVLQQELFTTQFTVTTLFVAF